MLQMTVAIAILGVTQMHGQHGKHGNPEDLEAYIARMEEPGRAEWQKPDEVVGALGLQRGQVACDIGAGPGYFALRIARAVGEDGGVYAVDVEPRILEALRKRLQPTGLLEQVAHAAGAHADEHLDEVGTGDRVERHARLA